MKIVIIGGTGLIGSKTVRLLMERGHEVIAASPNTGINTITGEGLDAGLAGAQVVIDLANSPSFEDKAVLDFFETSGRKLITAEIKAGVWHHIALSVCGTEDLQESGYFRAKLVQEKLIKASPIAYTIVHSTQFMEFLGGIAKSAGTDGPISLSTAMIQPIASDDVALAMADAALREPANGTIEIAGPETFGLADLVARYLADIGDAHKVDADPEAKYFGARLDEKSLLPRGSARLGAITYADWFKTGRPNT